MKITAKYLLSFWLIAIFALACVPRSNTKIPIDNQGRDKNDSAPVMTDSHPPLFPNPTPTPDPTPTQTPQPPAQPPPSPAAQTSLESILGTLFENLAKLIANPPTQSSGGFSTTSRPTSYSKPTPRPTNTGTTTPQPTTPAQPPIPPGNSDLDPFIVPQSMEIRIPPGSGSTTPPQSILNPSIPPHAVEQRGGNDHFEMHILGPYNSSPTGNMALTE